MNYNADIIDKAAWTLSSALILIGIVVLGVVELLTGEPYGAAELTNDAGEVVATPTVDPVLRTGLVILGFAVLLLWGLYSMASSTSEPESDSRGVRAD